MKTLSIWAAIALFAASSSVAFAGKFSLQGTEVHTLQSETLEETVEIAVALPFGYQASSAKFPLLVALDGDIMFGMSAEVPRLLSFEGKVPPMIIATLAYGDLNKWIQKRQQDFHPAQGGAERFLYALEHEVLRLLKTQYRVDETSLGLYGHSSAGLFAVFAGISSPGLFTHILATSPSLEEEPDWAQGFLSQIVAAPILPKFYLSSDNSEQAVHEALVPSLNALKEKGGVAKTKYQRFETGGHMAVIPASYVAGLHFLFAN